MTNIYYWRNFLPTKFFTDGFFTDNVVVLPESEVNLFSKKQWFHDGRISFREYCLRVITPKLFNLAEEKYAIKYLIRDKHCCFSETFLQYFRDHNDEKFDKDHQKYFIFQKNTLKLFEILIKGMNYGFWLVSFETFCRRKFRTRLKIVKTNSAKTFFSLGRSTVMSFISFTVVFTLKKYFVWESVWLFRQYSMKRLGFNCTCFSYRLAHSDIGRSELVTVPIHIWFVVL